MDADGKTTVDGLWAAGEVTSTGVHGANRLASNSLLEAVVFAARIAENIKGMLPESSLYEWPKDAGENDELVTLEDSRELKTLRSAMSAHAGVIRDADGLKDLIRQIVRLEGINKRVRFSNMATAAKLIATAALKREESRGGHYRSDFPDAVEAFRHRSFMTLKDADRIAAEIVG